MLTTISQVGERMCRSSRTAVPRRALATRRLAPRPLPGRTYLPLNPGALFPDAASADGRYHSFAPFSGLASGVRMPMWVLALRPVVCCEVGGRPDCAEGAEFDRCRTFATVF
jgi:hypothetical protein